MSEDCDGLERVGIRDLRNNVAALVRRAAAGERIVITSGGVPVAVLDRSRRRHLG